MFEEAVEEAKGICKKFLINPESTPKEIAEAFGPVLSALHKVAVTAQVVTGGRPQRGCGLGLYTTTYEVGPIFQIMSIFMKQDGRLVKRDIFTCCPDKHQVFRIQVYKVDLEDVLSADVSITDILKGVKNLLADSDSAIFDLTRGEMM